MSERVAFLDSWEFGADSCLKIVNMHCLARKNRSACQDYRGSIGS